jgi:hypothetical protein
MALPARLSVPDVHVSSDYPPPLFWPRSGYGRPEAASGNAKSRVATSLAAVPLEHLAAAQMRGRMGGTYTTPHLLIGLVSAG